VRDVVWDGLVGELSGRAFLAAGKDAKKLPYVLLFGTVTAKAAKRLGPAKATTYGTTLLTRATELAHPELAPTLSALSQANTTLGEASEQRRTARDASLVHEIRRMAALDRLELLASETQLGILERFVGHSDLVRAILAPDRPVEERRTELEDEGDGVGEGVGQVSSS
jgi:hypothetical protein